MNNAILGGVLAALGVAAVDTGEPFLHCVRGVHFCSPVIAAMGSA